MDENGALKVVSESEEEPTKFQRKMDSDKANSFWKEERILEFENCTKFEIVPFNDVQYSNYFLVRSLCENDKFFAFDEHKYNSFCFVDLPIFHYFLALKSNNGIYFFSRQSIDENSPSSELKKLRFVGETFGNDHGKAALLEFQLLPVPEPNMDGMHFLHLIGSRYNLVAHTKEDGGHEYLLQSEKDKNTFLCNDFY